MRGATFPTQNRYCCANSLLYVSDNKFTRMSGLVIEFTSNYMLERNITEENERAISILKTTKHPYIIQY